MDIYEALKTTNNEYESTRTVGEGGGRGKVVNRAKETLIVQIFSLM